MLCVTEKFTVVVRIKAYTSSGRRIAITNHRWQKPPTHLARRLGELESYRNETTLTSFRRCSSLSRIALFPMGPGPFIATNHDQPASSARILLNCLVDLGKLAAGL